MAEDQLVRVDGRTFKLTNLDKVLYPVTGTTKADVIGYFAEVAQAMLPHVVGRPVTRKRWPNGVQAEPFFEKNVAKGTPDWIDRVTVAHHDKPVVYPLVDEPAALVWLGQNAALELHVPQWKFDTDNKPGDPDRIVFDLDPGPGVTLADCAAVARMVAERMRETGLELYPVTSGSKGLHLYAKLTTTMTSRDTSALARHIARTIEQDHPDLVVSQMSKALRAGKVFIDWSQNNAAKTTIAPYSLRGRERPTVAAPRSWAELEDPALANLDYRQVLKRLEQNIDPLDGLDETPSRGKGSDRLTRYRSMRSADRTPEPVPESGAQTPGQDDSFVIQEHHATALHWDLRLERGGVLASWAVPRGIPTDGKHNRLAVQTEDHPMEYATFAGIIPRGEYGGGSMTIWDSGTYTTEKWWENEIIIDLHGSRATGRFVLVRTNGKNWLMHRMKGQPDLPEVVAQPDAEHRAAAARARPDPGDEVARHLLDTPGEDRVSRQERATSAGVKAPGLKELPPAPKPMLATAGSLDDLAAGTDWRFEGKWDGVRAIARIAGGAVDLTARSGSSFTAIYPELAELGEILAGHRVILDGEVVALDTDGRSSFPLLQQRMKLTKPAEIRRVAQKIPVVYLAFDVLYVDGVDLADKKFDDRRKVLQALHIAGEYARVPDLLDGPAAQALRHSRELDWEGIIAKDAAATYRPGSRGRSWFKIKNHRDQEVVVIGWRPGSGRRAGVLGSLLLAVPGLSGRLRYAGRVGTGFTDAVLEQLTETLRGMQVGAAPVDGELPRMETKDAHWVRPELVGEVRFSEWSPDGVVRQSSWRGLRPDKAIADIEPVP